ncbi:MAG TPA: GNAT family N-acetyltransferase [Gammaproteobacteria bacterium]|nr:GNAT family N-acetyltransferase [Gammaproteobacteria bacterium]
MRIATLDGIDAAPADEWNRLAGSGNPFLCHEFLAALEHNGCVGTQFGWLPRHLAAYDEHGRLVGAMPLYEKDNSYGEFVFDWAWADAYERNGLRYYPKLVTAIPYTPATGARLLVDPAAPAPEAVAAALVAQTLEYARAQALSSAHWLFTDRRDTGRLESQGLMLRLGCQFHWHNAGYRDFDDFLDTFSAQKRKKLRRERRRVGEAGVELRIIHGDDADEATLRTAHHFYHSTFDRKWGIPTLNLGFFTEVARTMGSRLVLVLAYENDRPVAGAICFRGDDTLYGRHWGCDVHHHSLHFEACYYQGIEYCIRHGLGHFEPGAQGEHKISRGFVPTPTWSAHWIAHPGFRDAIGDFLRRETPAMERYMQELTTHLPYKAPAGSGTGSTG